MEPRKVNGVQGDLAHLWNLPIIVNMLREMIFGVLIGVFIPEQDDRIFVNIGMSKNCR
ncbi:hypothetical protein D3C78_1721020 [compost metagenome]